MLPFGSKVMANGPLSVACSAGPLSPEKLAPPVPAIVLTMPPVTLRIRFAFVSTINTFPAESTAIDPANDALASVAGPVSPHMNRRAVPRNGCDDPVGRDLPDPLVAVVVDVNVSGGIDTHAQRTVQLCHRRKPAVTAKSR